MSEASQGGYRNPNRIEVVLAILRNVWRLHPDWRLGQVMVNALDGEMEIRDLFYMEDDELQRRLVKIIEESQKIQ